MQHTNAEEEMIRFGSTRTTSTPTQIPPTLPTVLAVSSFLSSFFPIRAKDVAFEYHSPRYPPIDPASTPVRHVIFSITPTEGWYTAMNQRARIHPLGFLHRPFGLDRRSLRRGSTVLSCHTGFDEVLSVGWNTVLAARLGLDVDNAVCLQGYKGDLDRRIGIVGRVKSLVQTMVSSIEAEFGTIESTYNIDTDAHLAEVQVLAIMNAFHPEEVERVVAAARDRGWIGAEEDCSKLMYLTGQPREPGLVAARDKGVKVVCVGHRPAEEWGVRYLATRTRLEFPALHVDEVYEAEPPKTKTETQGDAP